jgi:hypothetical protein
VPLVLEVSYEAPAGLRHDYDSQLKLGGLFVPVAAEEPPEAFATVLLLLVVDGHPAVRVQTRLTVAGADSLCVELLPEAAAPLAEAVARICENYDASASKDRRRVRLLQEEPPADRPEVLTLDRRIAAMTIGEKIRLAGHGTKDERVFLARDRAGVIQASVVRNPNVTIDEVLALARSSHLSAEAAQVISVHPTWGVSTQVAYALVRNPRTPVALAVEMVPRLVVADLRVVAKGLGVKAQVAQAARRKLLG